VWVEKIMLGDKMRLMVLLASIVVVVTGCGNGDGKDPVFNYLDMGDKDAVSLPDVPSHIFEMIQELPLDWTTADGKDQPKDNVEDPDGDAVIETDQMIVEDQIQADGACKPNCTFQDGAAKECGPDGCGSICGYCDYEHICVEGACEEYCAPQCTLPGGEMKQCGPDGCYGECPPGCDEDYKCGEDGLCYPDCDHDEKCMDKECGPDGCGGTCGACGLGFVCNEEAGLCDADPCGTLDKDKGECKPGNVLVQCVDGQLLETHCPDLGENYYCKWDGPDQKFVCIEGVCVPNCEFPDETLKECGYDGCYGVCGNCSDGWTCEAGKCDPVEGADCGWITDSGFCLDNTLWFCNNKILYVDDCVANGMNCMFDTGTGNFKCK
jgi:hypothetical protein